MAGLVLFAFLVIQVPADLEVAAEESLDNLAKCDNFYCEFELKKVRLAKGAFRDFPIDTCTDIATCRVHWWKIGGVMKYSLGSIDNHEHAVSIDSGEFSGEYINGWFEQQILSDGNFTLVLTDDRLGQVFSRGNDFPGPEITPLNLLGMFGSDLKSFPGHVIRGVGKFLKIDQVDLTNDKVSFRSTSISNPKDSAEIRYTLDSLRGMSPVQVEIKFANVEGVAQVREFSQINGAWFPSVVTYAQQNTSSSDAPEGMILNVKALRPFSESSALGLKLQKGTVLNDDIEDHVQLTLDRERDIKLPDLSLLHKELSQPDIDVEIGARDHTSNSRVIFRVVTGCLFVVIIYLLVSMRNKRR